MSQLEHVGALYIENQRLLEEYRKLLELMQRIKDGAVCINKVSVDMVGLNWSLAMTGEDLAEELK